MCPLPKQVGILDGTSSSSLPFTFHLITNLSWLRKMLGFSSDELECQTVLSASFSYRQIAIELEVIPQTQKADLSSAQIGAVSPNS